MNHPQFSKPRFAITVAAAAALVAAVTAAAPAVAQPEPPPGRPAQGAAAIVPLSADLEVSRTTAGKQTEGKDQHLYRDGEGRTRTDAGATVTISAPAGGGTITLDTTAHTYVRSAKSTAPDSSERQAKDDQKLASEPRFLGTAKISGVETQGREYTVSLPAHGTQIPARTKKVVLWMSTDLQLTVKTTVVEESGDTNTQTYTNIRTGEPDASLFSVPAGYRETTFSADAATNGGTCDLRNDDPVILTSVGYIYLDAKYVNAETVLPAGCAFIYDDAYFEYPLNGGPTTPLFLWYDQWLAFDCYCPLPYMPYVAFGDIVFVAGSPFLPDVTTKDSLVVLTVFPE